MAVYCKAQHLHSTMQNVDELAGSASTMLVTAVLKGGKSGVDLKIEAKSGTRPVNCLLIEPLVSRLQSQSIVKGDDAVTQPQVLDPAFRRRPLTAKPLLQPS